jgi:hypothetical protein
MFSKFNFKFIYIYLKSSQMLHIIIMNINWNNLQYVNNKIEKHYWDFNFFQSLSRDYYEYQLK